MGTVDNGVAGALASAWLRLSGVPLPIAVRGWDGTIAAPDGAGGPVLEVRSPRALRRLLWSPGELGLARGYVSGDLEVVVGDIREGLRRCWAAFGGASVRPGPRDLLALMPTAARLGAYGPPPSPPPQEVRVHGRLHSRRRDRAVIAHHYDLGNDFYQLILDPRMAYSCGYWAQGIDRLATAQEAKLELICRKLRLRPGDRLLDIGCGWGSLICYAAERFGVTATGVTVSAEQRDFIVRRLANHDLAGRVEVRLEDYRELSGERYDAVASIEMGEHVGERNYARYVAAVHDAVAPGGRVVIQQMSRTGSRPGGGPFIESYIAPDMSMRPVRDTVAHLRAGGLDVEDVQPIGPHYVKTVDAWADELERRWDEVVGRVGMGWARVWRLYLAGGSLAFESGRMGVEQFTAVRPDPDAATTAGRSGTAHEPGGGVRR